MINLMHGDCLELLKTVPDNSIDLILVDPPYGTTQCKWDSVIDLQLMWEQINRIKKERTAVLIMSAQPFTSILIASNLKQFKYDLIWEKGNASGFFNAKKMPLRAHEIVTVFYDKLPTYNPQMTHGHKRKTAAKKEVNSECYGKAFKKTHYDSTSRYPRSVQKISSDKQKSNLHPTQKPLELKEYLIKTYSNEGGTVLDFTMGSGTTGVACVNTGRKFIGIELDEDYFKIAEERINAAMRKTIKTIKKGK